MGIVEAAKKFGVTDLGSQALAIGLGIFFTGLAYGLNQELIPAVAAPYITWGVTAIAGGLAAMGYYDLAKRLLVRSR